MKRNSADRRERNKSFGNSAISRIFACAFGGFFLWWDWMAIQNGVINVGRRGVPMYRDSDPEMFWTVIAVSAAIGLLPILAVIRKFLSRGDD